MADTPAINGNGQEPMPSIPQEFRALSVLFDRINFMRQAGITFGGKRDTYEVFGYDREITTSQYRDRYARGGIAGRIVDVMPDATWRGVPSFEIVEDKDGSTDTTFELAWKDLDQRLQIGPKLHRVDKLARLSSFAVILIGEPLGNLNDELPKGRPEDLTFLSLFSGGSGPGMGARHRVVADDADATIQTWEADVTNPRFGMPAFYTLRRMDVASPMLSQPCHWSRIVHVAEGLLENDVYGLPAMERVWNLLDDLDKVTGGGAEAFFLRANQGMHIDVAKDMGLPETTDAIKLLKEQAEDYHHQLTRWLRTRGTTVTPLGSDVANFGPPADAVLTQIAGAKAIPKRILTGSEMGELASSQDRENFKDQVNGRQTQYAGPQIVRQLVDRLIKYGYLPTPAGGPSVYEVKWPHMQVLTEDEKAAGSAKWAEVNRAAGVTVFTADEIKDHWYGMGKADVVIQDQWRAELAVKLANANKTAGETIFTSDEIRKTCYGWKPLPPALRVPVLAPERVTAQAPTPPVDAAGGKVMPPKAPMSVVARAAQDAAYKFSSTQIQLPVAIANVLLDYGRSIPAFDLSEKGLEDDAHVTVKYGIHSNDVEPVRRVLQSSFGPIRIALGKTAVFSGPNYDVLYVEVDSPDLVALNESLSSQLEVTDTQNYMPHATIGYFKQGLGSKYAGSNVLEGMSASVVGVRFTPADGEPVDVQLPVRVAASAVTAEVELLEALEGAITAGETGIVDSILGLHRA